MLKIEPFSPDHATELEIQPAQKHVDNHLTLVDWNNLRGYTVFVGDKPIFCGGMFKMYGHRFVAWSLIAWNAGKYLRAIMRRINRYFRIFYRGCRIECTVDISFKAAHRFAKLLGFQLEAERMQQYEVDRRDMSLYAMIIA